MPLSKRPSHFDTHTVSLGDAVDDAVDHVEVEPLAPVGDHQGRPHQHGAVQLVEVPLVRQEAVDAGELLLGLGRVEHAVVVEQRREEHAERHHAQRQVAGQGVVVVRPAGGRCASSRAVGRAFHIGSASARGRSRRRRTSGWAWCSCCSRQLCFGVPRPASPRRRRRCKTARTISGTVIDPRRFVGVFVNVVVARLAGEGHEPHAEHVKRRDAGRHQRQQEQQQVLAGARRRSRTPGRGSRPCCTSR